MQPTERNAQLNEMRRPVNPRLHFQKRILPTEPDMDHLLRQFLYFKAHDVLRKARKHKSGGYKNYSGKMAR